MGRSNFIDRVVGWIDPAAGVERAKARLALDVIQSHKVRNYEGASSGRRTDGWRSPNTSAKVATETAIIRLRNRSRDLTRNNPYASKALQVISNNVVGTGIVPRFVASRQNRASKAKEVWRQWAETTQCDIEGRNTIYGLQNLIMRTVAESGECLVRRVWKRGENGLALPFQLQILEPDYIDVSKDYLKPDEAGTQLIQGIKLNKEGKRIAYMLYDQHPGDNHLFSRNTSKEVPAEDIIHIYRVDRPGQIRGVPWSAPVIIKLRDFDDHEDAQLLRQKIAACFAVFVTDSAAGELGTNGKPTSIADTVEPGIIETLPPGKTIQFADPPGVTGYNEYASTILRGIAAGYGVTYESLTGDLNNVNFSSGRMGWIEFHRNVESWRWTMFIPQFCDSLWAWCTQASVITANNISDVMVQWTPPKREMIDPAAETKAAKEAVRAGFMTLPEAIRELGQDPDMVLAEHAETAKKLDDLGLILECDPRKTTQAGMLQVDPSQQGRGANSNESNNNA